MALDRDTKRKFEELPLADKVNFIIEERTPKQEQVIYNSTINFLDPHCDLTREERARVIAMGDRTAISYNNLALKILEGRGNPEATADFFLAYTLSARSSNEISHTSILEQVNAGWGENTGDSPIIMEGVSVLSGLRDICSLRHFGFEAFSSRGGIFPVDYWRVPKELGSKQAELEAINRKVYEVYSHLTKKGLEHYLLTLKQTEGEKGWQFRWRVLNHALDDARQVTNQSFLNHLAMHPNSALSLREGIAKLGASDLPETVKISNTLRDLAERGLPTLMKYTEPSSFEISLEQKRQGILKELSLENGQFVIDKVGLINVKVTENAERIFLSAFLANGSKLSVRQIHDSLKSRPDEKVGDMIQTIFSGFGLHDKPPKELEMIQVVGNFNISIGAFYELVRHRLATFIVGDFDSSTHTTPKVYEELRLSSDYEYGISLNKKARDIIRKLGPGYSSFIPYFAARADVIPVTMRISAMDVFHLLKLRASGGAHPDIKGPSTELINTLQVQSWPIFRWLIKK